MERSSESLAGSDSLLLRVRGDFTTAGTSFSAWCRRNKVDHGHAHRVVRGFTNGPQAQALRIRIVRAAELATR